MQTVVAGRNATFSTFRLPEESEVTLDAFQKGLVELLPRQRRFERALTAGPVDAVDLMQAAVDQGWTGAADGARTRAWTAGCSRQ